MNKFYARSLTFARQALHWWLGELADMVPDRVKQKLTFAGSHLVLAQDDNGYALLHCSGSNAKPLGRIAADAVLSPATLSAAIGDARLARRVLRGKLPLSLRLPAGRRGVVACPACGHEFDVAT